MNCKLSPILVAGVLGLLPSTSFADEAPSTRSPHLEGTIKTKTGEKQDNAATVLIPYALGNWWMYRVSEEKDGEVETRTVTNKVLAVRLFEQETVFKLKAETTWFHSREFEFHFWSRTTKRGVWDGRVGYPRPAELVDEMGDSRGESDSGSEDGVPAAQSEPEVVEDFGEQAPRLLGSSLFLKYPVMAGQKWKLGDGEDGEDGTEMKCVAVNKEITVPAGKFKCVVYESSFDPDANEVDRYYICPGVGYVKFETMGDAGPLVYQLSKYKLSKSK